MILKDISMNFESNKIYGIVGDNGAGKQHYLMQY